MSIAPTFLLVNEVNLRNFIPFMAVLADNVICRNTHTIYVMDMWKVYWYFILHSVACLNQFVMYLAARAGPNFTSAEIITLPVCPSYEASAVGLYNLKIVSRSIQKV